MPDDKDVRNKKIRIGIIYFVIVIVLMFGVNYVLQSSRVQDVIYSEFKQWVKDGKRRCGGNQCPAPARSVLQ
ncbi:MAG: ATP-dependent metallopeptidase FtsH/Yme1/Tma family protein [Clostridia bacterium]